MKKIGVKWWFLMEIKIKKQLSSTNPVSTLSSSVANFHQRKSSSTGLRQRCERQGHKKGEGKFYPPGNSNDNINPLIEWAYIITGSSGCTEFPFLLNIVVLSKYYSKLLKLKVWKALILRHSMGDEYGFNSRHQLFYCLKIKDFLNFSNSKVIRTEVLIYF